MILSSALHQISRDNTAVLLVQCTIRHQNIKKSSLAASELGFFCSATTAPNLVASPFYFDAVAPETEKSKHFHAESAY